LAAAIIDSLGTGLFLPFAVLYFLRTTPLSLTTVGTGLSAGAALVIVLVPLTGVAVDHFGPVTSVVTANLLQAAGFAAYLGVRTLWQLVICAVLVQAGSRLFWTANGALVALVADPGQSVRWFALLRGLRNGGFAIGGALGAAAAAINSPAAYRAVVALNALSYLLAAALITMWAHRRLAVPNGSAPSETANSQKQPRPPAAQDGWLGYRPALTDLTFLLVLAATFWFVLCALTLDVLLTVDVTSALHLPAWLASLLFTLSGLLVFAGQTALTRRLERASRIRVLRGAALLWSASFLVLSVLVATPTDVRIVALFVAVVAFTAAEMLALPVLNDIVLSLAPHHQQGRYFAVQGLTWIVPQAIAPAAFTWMFARGSPWPWLAAAAGCAITIAILHRLHLWLPTEVDQPEPTHTIPAEPQTALPG
jgi:MFS family permease